MIFAYPGAAAAFPLSAMSAACAESVAEEKGGGVFQPARDERCQLAQSSLDNEPVLTGAAPSGGAAWLERSLRPDCMHVTGSSSSEVGGRL